MTSFLELYQSNIAPKIRSLDLLLKTMEEPLDASDVAEALCITEREASLALKRLGVDRADKKALLRVMETASSGICRLYQREMRVGSPYVYTREDVAYIYGLPLGVVNRACEDLGILELTEYTMADLFSRLQLSPVFGR
ncbi:MAG: hypothetical protein LBT59_02805 [Clostridiales bacterium]|nr:hypothetical protein [Clostridiales bacterium]